MRYGWLTGFVLHAITGVVAVAAHYSVMWLLLYINQPPLLASTLGFIVGAATRFFLSYCHVFSPESEIPKAMSKFIFVLAVQMSLNAILLALFSKSIPIWESQVAATLTLTVFNYIAYRLWVFR